MITLWFESKHACAAYFTKAVFVYLNFILISCCLVEQWNCLNVKKKNYSMGMEVPAAAWLISKNVSHHSCCIFIRKLEQFNIVAVPNNCELFALFCIRIFQFFWLKALTRNWLFWNLLKLIIFCSLMINTTQFFCTKLYWISVTFNKNKNSESNKMIFKSRELKYFFFLISWFNSKKNEGCFIKFIFCKLKSAPIWKQRFNCCLGESSFVGRKL